MIPTTDSTRVLITYVLALFREHYLAEAGVRQLGLSYGKLVWNESLQLDLPSEPGEQVNGMELNYLIDKIRQKFGFQALIHISSLLENVTVIHRSGLVGRHAGGSIGLGGQHHETNKRRIYTL